MRRYMLSPNLFKKHLNQISEESRKYLFLLKYELKEKKDKSVPNHFLFNVNL